MRGLCLYGDCYGGRGLVRDCDCAALRLVPLMCRLCRPKGRDDPSQLVGGDARIKAMIAELQESIDFNS